MWLRPALALAGLLLAPAVFGHEADGRRLADLTRRIWRSPHDATLLIERGELHRLAGAAAAAEADYGRARRLDPGLPAVDLGIGLLRAAQGRDAEAREALDRFLARRPDAAAGLTARARVLARLGRPLDAARDWSRAIDGAGGAGAPQPDWYLERARALDSAGEAHLEQARAGLEEGIVRLGRPVSLLRAAEAIDERRARSGLAAAAVPLPQNVPVPLGDTAPRRPSPDSLLGHRPDPSLIEPETVLVQLDGPMRYRANAANPGIGVTWTQEAFNDAGWPSGSYGVGYETGSGAVHLLRTNVPAGAFSVYTRAHFTIADLASVGNVFLGADYDDGYVAWINGVEVYRSPEMPAGTPAWNTNAGLARVEQRPDAELCAAARHLGRGARGAACGRQRPRHRRLELGRADVERSRPRSAPEHQQARGHGARPVPAAGHADERRRPLAHRLRDRQRACATAARPRA